MSLEEYEKIQEERRRELNRIRSEEVKVDMTQFKGMKAYTGRGEEEVEGLQLATKKAPKKGKKKAQDSDEEEEEEEETIDVSKLVNFRIAEPSSGYERSGRGGRGGRGEGRGGRGEGRGRGGRGGRGGRFEGRGEGRGAGRGEVRGGPSINVADDSHFPTLGGK